MTAFVAEDVLIHHDARRKAVGVHLDVLFLRGLAVARTYPFVGDLDVLEAGGSRSKLLLELSQKRSQSSVTEAVHLFFIAVEE